MARERARIGSGRHDLRERGVLTMVGGSKHHALYAYPRQYSQKEQPVLWSRTFYLSARTQSLHLPRRPSTQLRGASLSQSSLQLHRDTQEMWPMFAPTTMHHCCLPGPYHPPERTSPTTCAGVG